MNCLPEDPRLPIANLNRDETFLNRYNITANTIHLNVVDRFHYHDYFQLYYTVKGEYLHTVNGKEKLCKPGDVTLVMPYTVHGLDTREFDMQNAFIVSISFLPKLFSKKRFPLYPLTNKEAIYKKAFIPTSLQFTGKDKESADTLISELYHEYEKRSDMFLTKILKNLSHFFDICAKNSEHKFNEPELTDLILQSELIYKETDYIAKHFTEKLSIDDAAHRAAMSRCVFTKTFRKVSGMSYHEMLMSTRLINAIELMRYTKKSIAEIASECGFSSSAHFTRECMKNFFYPPLKLRNIMIERTREREREMPGLYSNKAWESFRSRELIKEHRNNSLGKE